MLLTILACGFGLASGWIAARLSIACARRLGDGGFWGRMAAVSRLLVSSEDESRLLAEYLRLWPALFAFLGRQLVIAAVALAPVATAYAGVAPLAGTSSPDFFALEIPSLGDWQLYFLAAVIVGSIAGWLVARRA